MFSDVIEVDEVQPIRNCLCVRCLEESERTPSGLIIPYADNGKGQPNHGKVVAVGIGYFAGDDKYYPLEYKIGDIVLYGRNTGHSISIKGVLHKIITDEDVMAIYIGEESSL